MNATATATRSAAEVLAKLVEARADVSRFEAEWDAEHSGVHMMHLPEVFKADYFAACHRHGAAEDAARAVLTPLLKGKPEDTQVVSGGYAFRLTRWSVGFTPVVTVTDDTPNP